MLTILITGVSSGIGRATALELLRAGHTVYAGARRVETMDAIRASGGHALSLDVTKEADLERAVNTMIDEQGRIDVLVNNAGSDTFGDVTVRAVRGYSGKGAHRELAEGLAKNTEAIYSENSRASAPIVVAKTIRKAVESARPKPRYPVGHMARPLLALNRLLPDRAFERIATSQTRR